MSELCDLLLVTVVGTAGIGTPSETVTGTVIGTTAGTVIGTPSETVTGTVIGTTAGTVIGITGSTESFETTIVITASTFGSTIIVTISSSFIAIVVIALIVISFIVLCIMYSKKLSSNSTPADPIYELPGEREPEAFQMTPSDAYGKTVIKEPYVMTTCSAYEL